jgi:Kdo2-lipid IVA lauroyltransferase/acyltransferase
VAKGNSAGRRLIHLLEGVGAFALYGFFRVLPVACGSGLAGFLARNIGPHLGIHRRAQENLRRAMPELDDAAVDRTLRGMWDNLGRVVAEYAHLDKFHVYEPGGRIEIVDAHHIRDRGGDALGTIFISAHFGNWEVLTLSATQAGLKVAEIYRPADNPVVDRLIGYARRAMGSELVPKGTSAARRAVAAIKEGRHIAMLVDQKMTEGLAVPFFGREAMTAPALARLALRYGSPVVAVRVERLPRARFRIIAEPPIPYERTGDNERDTLSLLTQVNAVLERWIRAKPDHWIWVHRRWPD